MSGVPDGLVDFEGVAPTATVPVGVALEIPCELSNDADAIYAYFLDVFEDAFDGQPFADERAEAEAIMRAYPHILKSSRTVTIEDSTRVITPRTVMDSMVMIDGVWVLIDVVVKDTTYTPNNTDVQVPTIIPLPKTTANFPNGGTVCNLAIKCTDWNFPGCAGPLSKTRRDWQVLDWCTGVIQDHVQWIVQEPAVPEITYVIADGRAIEADDIQGETIYVDIAPWTCSGSISLSAIAEIDCDIEIGEITIETSAGSISGGVITGLWVDEPATVTVRALSDCGVKAQFDEVTFFVEATNSIFPVPVAEDQVKVSITFDPTGTQTEDGEPGGTAKVFVDAIDAGSHNSNCGEVTSCLLLQEEFDNPIFNADGVQLTDAAGNLLYVAAGCVHDGVIRGTPASKNIPGSPDIYYGITQYRNC